MKVHVYVTLKPAVLDPQGKAIEASLRRIGYDGATDVRVGKFIQMDLKTSDKEKAKAQVEEMCKKLLSNPVIEDARYEFAG